METKYKCPSCHHPLHWHREGDFGIIYCDSDKCLDEMQGGASGQSQIEAWHELRQLHRELKED